MSVGSDCNATDTQGNPVTGSPTDHQSETTDSVPNGSQTDGDSASLSTGAIAGIAGGAAGALAAIAIILCLCFRRRKKQRKLRDERGILPSDGAYEGQKNQQYYEAEARQARHELHNQATSELAAPGGVGQLYGDESKQGWLAHKYRASPTVAYELAAARSP